MNDILAILEDEGSDDEATQFSEVDVVMIPPTNATGYLSDDDSGEVKQRDYLSQDDFDSDDDVPLVQIIKKT